MNRYISIFICAGFLPRLLLACLLALNSTTSMAFCRYFLSIGQTEIISDNCTNVTCAITSPKGAYVEDGDLVNAGGNVVITGITIESAAKKGDVNGDGNVDVADIASVIDVMSGKVCDSPESADVNADGNADVADIAMVIDIMAGKIVEDDPVMGNAPAGTVAVDLGLPSGTKWASMNIGAEKPEDYGLFFAWGETVGYTSDSSDGRSFDWASYKWCSGSSTSLTKYCISSIYGTVDNKTVLDLEDDAARANWGGNWQMPTYEDFQELLVNTTGEWTTVGTVMGLRFTSKVKNANGMYNSIFFPATGYRGYTLLIGNGSNVYCWTATIGPLGSYIGSRQPYFYSSGVGLNYNGDRCYGRSVRAVLKN